MVPPFSATFGCKGRVSCASEEVSVEPVRASCLEFPAIKEAGNRAGVPAFGSDPIPPNNSGFSLLNPDGEVNGDVWGRMGKIAEYTYKALDLYSIVG